MDYIAEDGHIDYGDLDKMSSPPPAPEPEPETANIVVPVEVVNAIRTAPAGQEILATAVDVAVFLSQKNASYGNSALNPVRIVSKASALEQIKVRIDDKLNRMIQGQSYVGDDDLKDLLGYLILYFTAERVQGSE